jgi:hypothetical protein
MIKLLGAAGPVRAPERVIAALLLILAALYLIPFVDRGWVPVDEGMIGQAAERVLTGALPHVDYEEPYPGALSYFYASVFKIAGIDLVHLRWTVFAGALVSLTLVYLILRRYLHPVSAALATWVAAVWSFPNYFSSLPSWWILLCALGCIWGVIRYVESERLLFVVVAGLSAGIAVSIKQTGVYLLPPLVMSLMIGSVDVESARPAAPKWESPTRAALAIAAFVFVLVILWRGLGLAEIVYLVVPIAASCISFSLFHRLTPTPGGMNWRAAILAAASAAIPVAILLLPHITTGHVRTFVNGVIVLPQKRLQFNALPMRPVTQMVAAVAGVMWVFWSPRSLTRPELRILGLARWVAAVALALFSLRSNVAYIIIWEAVRGMAALLPIIALWLLTSNPGRQDKERRVLFATSAILAWASLSQFPFAAPIYFCYVAPLALIAGVAVVASGQSGRRLSDGPACTVALLFALLCLNRGYVWHVGSFHQVQHLNTPLALPRASLYVSDQEATVYGRVVPLVQQHLGVRGLVAGPDTPEIYFLTGQFSPSGRLFEFFSQDSVSDARALEAWTRADVIVMYHGQRFSPPLSTTLTSKLREEFPKGESVAPFEVRWR